MGCADQNAGEDGELQEYGFVDEEVVGSGGDLEVDDEEGVLARKRVGSGWESGYKWGRVALAYLPIAFGAVLMLGSGFVNSCWKWWSWVQV